MTKRFVTVSDPNRTPPHSWGTWDTENSRWVGSTNWTEGAANKNTNALNKVKTFAQGGR